jgi:adenylate kinase
VVTGTPGTGKTTFSRQLSQRLGATHLELSRYALDNGLVTERDEERDTSVVDLEAVKRSVKAMLKGGERLVVDGHYAHDAVSPGDAEAVIVLRRAPWVLAEELRGRGYAPGKVWENVEAEALAVCLAEALDRFPAEKVCELDTTGRTAQETLETGLAYLKGGCGGGYIDWLGYPETVELLRARPCT